MNQFLKKSGKIHAPKWNLQKIDLNIFSKPQRECPPISEDSPITESCAYTKRLCTASMYFHALTSSTTLNEEEIKTLLVDFNQNVYLSLIDDTAHFISEHDQDIERVHTEWTEQYGLPKCSVSQCAQTMRHYGRERGALNMESENGDELYSFYESLYDRVHLFIFHLFDIGMRVNSSSLTSTADSSDGDDESYGCSQDMMFAAEQEHIKMQQKKSSQSMDRIDGANTKFTIKTVSEQQGVTLTDALFDKLSEKEMLQKDTVQRVHEFLSENAFDSECIELDLDNISDSNLCVVIPNQSAIEFIAEFIRGVQCMVSLSPSTSNSMLFLVLNDTVRRRSFSTGVIFEYSSKKNMNKMYVKPSHKTLKQEVLDSGLVSMRAWEQCVILKAQQYLKSEKLQKMAAHSKSLLRGQPITLQHLLSIILYCDFSELCTAFSATYRREHVFESIESVILRHAKFANLGRLLMELVLCFGENRHSNDAKGPFYCGINCVLNIGSFAIHLKGPCSTSTVLAVALNFAKTVGGSGGMILKLNNDSYSVHKQYLFDCSWISNYFEEAERLWIAGTRPLRIESILIVETAKNYEVAMRALYVFDAMISGVRHFKQYKVTATKSEKKFVSNLINGNVDSMNLDLFLLNEWNLFVQKKKEIILNMFRLRDYSNSLLDLIMNDMVKGKSNEPKGNENMFKTEWISTFPSLKSIVILDYWETYKFRVEALLESVLSIPQSIKVIVIDEGTWTRKALNDEISESFLAAGWSIKYSRKVKREIQGVGTKKGGLVVKYIGNLL